MKLFNRFCIICGGSNDLHEHHTNYKDDKTVLLCRSCHMKVHKTDEFRNDLLPELSREEAFEEGYIEGYIEQSNSKSRKFTLYVSDDNEDLAAWIEKMSDVFGSESAVLKKGIEYLRKERGQELEILVTEDFDD